uniref:hypothetical protein n=1 Tax=Okeania sp. SIO2F4 TaxID=2607790 RepID=UPI0025DFB5D5|nr:hypothetical protein [Okeania sp. SIO2F4]
MIYAYGIDLIFNYHAYVYCVWVSLGKFSRTENLALNRQHRKTPPTPPKVDRATEGQIIALCCSEPQQQRLSELDQSFHSKHFYLLI